MGSVLMFLAALYAYVAAILCYKLNYSYAKRTVILIVIMFCILGTLSVVLGIYYI